MLSAAQANSGRARDAPGDRSRSQGLLVGDGLFWTAEYLLHRVGESDHPSWRLSSGTSHVGDVSAVLTLARPSGMVASVLPFCASPRITSSGARAATRARVQTSGTALSATDPSHGCGQNPSTMDDARGAHLPLAKGFRLRGIKPDVDAGSCCGEMGEGTRRRARMEPHAGKTRPVWTASSPKTRLQWVWRGLVDLSTISNLSTQLEQR